MRCRRSLPLLSHRTLESSLSFIRLTKSLLKGETMQLVDFSTSHQKALSSWRRRAARCALGAVGFTVLLAGARPAVAGAQQPASVKAAPSSGGIESDSPSESASYNKGFATVATDKAGDILLFHKASNAPAWTRTEIYSAADDGQRMVAPVLATSGKTFAIVAVEEDTDYLFSWIGTLTTGFTAQVVSDAAAYDGFSPSIAYSPLGDNYVLTDTDNSGNIDYWYSTTGSGGWQEQTAASESESGVFYYQSVISVTDMGVVIVGTDYVDDLNAFYEQFGSSEWSTSGAESVGSGGYLSITWSGSELYLALQVSGGVYLQGYSDVGVPDGILNEVYATPSYDAADYITWSGSNAVVVSEDGSGNLNFFYSNSDVTAFAQETIATVPPTLKTGVFPAVVVGHKLVVVTDATSKGNLYAWLQPVGGDGWTQQLIGK
jgi:hypothetical protein